MPHLHQDFPPRANLKQMWDLPHLHHISYGFGPDLLTFALRKYSVNPFFRPVKRATDTWRTKIVPPFLSPIKPLFFHTDQFDVRFIKICYLWQFPIHSGRML